MRGAFTPKSIQRASLHLSIWLLVGGVADCLADAPASVSAEDYARAERFLSWNKDRYVRNADVQHRWIGNEDRFWYVRTDAIGDKEFVIVDAASGERAAAFDHRSVAGALSAATGRVVAPGRLPFSSFRYTSDRAGIQFLLDEKLWICQLGITAACTPDPATPARHEVLSPDGKWAAFVRQHNLWIHPTSGGAEFPLSTDGIEHYSYATGPGSSTHAVSDRRSGRAAPPHVVWSPDSRFLITHRLDERQVKELFLIQSVPEDGSVRPKLYTYRYAMPGDEHVPLSQPIVFDVKARRKMLLATRPLPCLPQTFPEKRDAWWSADSKTVYYLSRDRFSKSIGLQRANPLTGDVDTVLQESSDTVVQTNANNVFDFPLVRTLGNGDVIWYSQRDGWGHLYYYGSSGRLRNRITHGDWAVRDIVSVDEAGETLYFMASARETGQDPYEQLLYSVRFDGSAERLLTPEEADHGRAHPWSRASPDDALFTAEERDTFSPSRRYFVDSYSRPDLPPVFVLRSVDGRLIKQLEQADISKLRQGGYTPVEPFKVWAADGKTALYGNLFRPSTFDPNKKYAIIDAIYPGPQAIRTGKSFTATMFDSFEAQSLAELGFVVITIDGRGTPNRSREFLDYSYGRLHKASELEDHIAGIRQLAQRYSYLDISRVGVDGASGGGFLAAQAILAYPDFYKVAVSAEGNHDQRGYLAPWGETYNGPLGQSDYAAASTLPRAENLRGKLLLMHGEMDDNVSPTLTLKLVDALVKSDKDFDLLILPNANHMAFVTSPYFIRRKWDYFVRHLMLAEPPKDYSIKYPH